MDLRELRLKAGITQTELANVLKCNKQQVYNWENKAAPVPFKYWRAYAKQLNVTYQKFVVFMFNRRNELFVERNSNATK
jgi:transcriptional regulator with XRE-family HTH domain